MTSLLLVSSQQALGARLPEVVAGRGLEFGVIGSARGLLMGSPFIDAYEQVAERPSEFTQVLIAHPELVDGRADWVLYDDDQLIRDLARGPWPESVKRYCLSAATDAGLAALGSKIGQQALAEAAGVPTPETRVVSSVDDVAMAVREMPGSLLLKADVGGGGAQVWSLRDMRDVSRVPRLPDQLPGPVQEWVEGDLISVEPLYRRGRLLGLQYSRVECAMGNGRGPSTKRRFLDPPGEVLDILAALGEAGRLHGFGNVTFVRCWRRQQHLLVECDMRINSCVQYGPQLGLDWAGLLTSDGTGRVATTSLGPAGRVIHVYPRAISAGLAEMSWASLRPWVMREEGTWEARNQRDTIVNAHERAGLISPPALTRHLLHDPLRAAWRRLPPTLSQSLESMGWKRKALRAMGIHV